MSLNSASLQLPAVTAQTVLEVVDGVHQGVTLALDKNVYSIGSKPGADIMLADDGVAPEHGVIRLHGHAVIVSRGRRYPSWKAPSCRARTWLPHDASGGTETWSRGAPESSGREPASDSGADRCCVGALSAQTPASH